MEHVVFFPTPEGAPAFRRVPSLEEAVRVVEHLRNVDGIAEVSVHALTEVPLVFRTWYRVEIPTEVARTAPVQSPLAGAPVVQVQVPAERDPVTGQINGGAKSLGLFA